MVETNQRLNDEFRKKTKAAQGFESMYNKLRHHQLNADVGVAADHDAETVLQGAAAGVQRISNQRTGGMPPRRSNSNGSGGSGEQRRMTLSYANGNHQTYRTQGSRAGLGTSRRSLAGFTSSVHLLTSRRELPECHAKPRQPSTSANPKLRTVCYWSHGGSRHEERDSSSGHSYGPFVQPCDPD